MERILKANFFGQLLWLIACDDLADACIVCDLESERPFVGEPLIEFLHQSSLELDEVIVDELVHLVLGRQGTRDGVPVVVPDGATLSARVGHLFL